MAQLTVAAGLAKRLMDFATTKGADPDALAERAGLDPLDLRDQDSRLPFASYVALMKAAKELTGDPALALRFGMLPMSEFSIVGLLFQACETVLESIVEINRYGRLIVEVDLGTADRFQLVRQDGALWMADTRRNPNDFPELTEATFARFIQLMLPFWSTPLVQEVHVTHAPPSHASEYERVLGAPTNFGTGWNAVRIDEGRLDHRIATQPRYAFGVLSERAEALLHALESSKTTRGRVESLLMPILHKGMASIELVAQRMSVSRQTVYRRLKAEEVSFEQVLDELRHKLALHYLDNGDVSVNEIAYLVGFSDPAAFSRAFKRWTGRSPSSMRALKTPREPAGS